MSDKKAGQFLISQGAPESSAVNMEFADGWHVIPQWMVAHLGGTDAVLDPKRVAGARKITFEQFNRAFHQTASAETLKKIQKSIIGEHLRSVFNR